MKKIILALLLVLALVTTSEGQRRISGVQRGGPSGAGDPLRTPTGGGSGSSPASGPAPGTLLLGNSSTAGSTSEITGNANTAYYMSHTGQATATVATAYFYDRAGFETTPAHVCIWNSSGTLLGCSGNITMGSSPGWRSVAWSGPAITASTAYYIGMVGSTDGLYTLIDDSSPTIVGCPADSSGQTFGSEGNVPGGTCSELWGSITIYVTN